MSKTYPLPNPAAICAQIHAAGGPVIDPSQPTGSVVTHGCKLLWTIGQGNIVITLASKPWIISDAQVFAELDKLFVGAK